MAAERNGTVMEAANLVIKRCCMIWMIRLFCVCIGFLAHKRGLINFQEFK